MVKGKKIKKSKKISKGKVRLPEKIKKGQITKTELKSVGFVAPDNKLKNSAPVESISGIGVKKGEMLRKGGVENVGDYRINFKDFAIKHRAKKIKKAKSKRKYYIVENKTGEILSKPLDSREQAEDKSKLFKSETSVILSKPENLERMGKDIKKRYVRPKKIERLGSAFDKDKFMAEKSRKMYRQSEPKPIMKGKYKLTVFDKAEHRDRKTSLVEIVDTKTGDKLEDWVLTSDIKDEKSIGELTIFKDRLKKKTTVSQKKGGGNDYIADTVIPEMMSKPKLSDWKNKEGKIRKKALRKHVIRIYEEEYGKDSVITEKTRGYTKDLTGKDNYFALKALSDNYPNDFLSEEELIKNLESQ